MEAFEDHHTFTKEEMETIKEEYKDYNIITTSKDLVKLQDFDLGDIYLMDLSLQLDEKLDLTLLDNFINFYK